MSATSASQGQQQWQKEGDYACIPVFPWCVSVYVIPKENMQMTMHVFQGFAKLDFWGQYFVLCCMYWNYGWHLQRSEMRLSKTDTGLHACVYVSHCFYVCRAESVDAWLGTVEKALWGIYLICKWKKHTRTFAKRRTHTHTQTQVCLFSMGMICNWIGMLQWLTSKFWQNSSWGKTSTSTPRTCCLPVYLLSIAACESTCI